MGIPTSATTDAPLLETRGLTKRFAGLVAVSDLDFEIRPNEILGLIGPNGAGKSTTFNLISGFLRPTEGRLHVLGQDVTGASAKKISRLGLVRTFQHGSVMPSMTVRDNILIGALSPRGRGGPAGRRSSVADAADSLGLTGYLDDRVSALPHGIQRLVSIAIAVAAGPRILCLDEPLTGLNQTEVQSTLEVLSRIKDEQGVSILLVEHNMKAVMAICDRIVVLHHGKRLATGTPDAIRHDPVVIKSYLGGSHADG